MRWFVALALSGALSVPAVQAQTSSGPAVRTAGELDEPGDDAPLGSGWRGALADSMRLLLIEHGVRVAFQDKTRSELGGPFLDDYRRSVRMPRTWGDGDHWLINYVGHPIHGAAAGHIWRDHDAKARSTADWSRAYWASQGRALAWATGYSLQFEFGPFSEASIGNVGLRPHTTGWVDHVVTPAGALGFLVAEDAIDRYVVDRFEGRVRNRAWRASMRMLLNPSRTLANTAQGRLPWHRPGRPLSQ